MGYYARINSMTMKVDNVIVADKECVSAFLDYDRWVEVDEGVCLGFSFDSAKKIFLPPSPYLSWSWSEDKKEWVPPVERTGPDCWWNEELKQWIEYKKESA